MGLALKLKRYDEELKYIQCEGMDWINLSQVRDK
jgi:hypothetical protein